MTQLRHSVTAYQTIRERIIALEADIDEPTLADTVEGLTDLHEVLMAVLRTAMVNEAMAEGLKALIAKLEQRKERLADRAANYRQTVRDAMVEVDLKRVAAPDFTATIRQGTPSVVVVEEVAIPATYWLPREPRLDRLSLLKDLKKGLSVDGAALSNPELVLSVRIK